MFAAKEEAGRGNAIALLNIPQKLI